MVIPRVRSCELTALTAALVEPEQQNQSDLVCGEEKTRRSLPECNPHVFKS